ncbi:unnamed protein product [Brachionus calyciflorus]|uniref:Uncharacterized protein n=1 Tax=Brachionus calyciflorus TaxID=104777 RepID=A0A813TZT5_9BILA|nr:unnamed protein product [Brachionus calyciflorus]
MENLSDRDLNKIILPQLSDKIEDCAEKNDFNTECSIQNDQYELIKILHEHSTLINLLQYNRLAFECCFSFRELYKNEELMKIYFKEIDSIIGIELWFENLVYNEDDDDDFGHVNDLKYLNTNDNYKRMSLTGKFFVEKFCNELLNCVEMKNLDKALKILSEHEEIINELNKYDGAFNYYFEAIYQNL